MAARVHRSGLGPPVVGRSRHHRRARARTALYSADLRYVLGHGRLANSSCGLRAPHPLGDGKIGSNAQVAPFGERGGRRPPGVERNARELGERFDSTIDRAGWNARTRRERRARVAAIVRSAHLEAKIRNPKRRRSAATGRNRPRPDDHLTPTRRTPDEHAACRSGSLHRS
jgi:hypothetical protein